MWGWLVGLFIDAWLNVYPDDIAGARHALEGFVPHLDEACIGSISEIFDAEAPFTPRGGIADVEDCGGVGRVGQARYGPALAGPVSLALRLR